MCIQCVLRKNCNPTAWHLMIKQQNLNQFKQNWQKGMLNNLSVTTHNFIKNIWKLTDLLIVKFLVLKVMISDVVWKNGNFMTVIILADFSCDFTHWTVFAWQTFYWLRTSSWIDSMFFFSCAHYRLCPAASPPLWTASLWPWFFVRVTQARQSPGFVRKVSNDFSCPIAFLLHRCSN